MNTRYLVPEIPGHTPVHTPGSHDMQLLGLPAGEQLLVPIEQRHDVVREPRMQAVHLLGARLVALRHCAAQHVHWHAGAAALPYVGLVRMQGAVT